MSLLRLFSRLIHGIPAYVLDTCRSGSVLATLRSYRGVGEYVVPNVNLSKNWCTALIIILSISFLQLVYSDFKEPFTR